jgi:hypothetical protein
MRSEGKECDSLALHGTSIDRWGRVNGMFARISGRVGGLDEERE